MTSSLVMLVGTSGVGKSTAAAFMVELGYAETSFAAPIKSIGRILGFSATQMDGTQEQKLEINDFWKVSGREFMQRFGSDVMRQYLPTVLPIDLAGVNIWARLVEKQISQHAKLVVSDGRFPDEADMVRRNGGVIVKIIRHAVACAAPTHQSETHAAQIAADYTIYNDGDITDLKLQVEQIIRDIEKKC